MEVSQLASNGVSRDIRKALFGWSNDEVADGYTHQEMFDISSYAPLVEATVSQDKVHTPQQQGS